MERKKRQGAGVAVGTPAPHQTESLATYWTQSEDDVLRALNSSRAGLSAREARLRLQRSGALAPHHHRTQFVLLARQFSSPITLILVFATILSAMLGDHTDAAVILAIVLLSGMLSAWQEYGASRAVEDLLATVQVTVEVLRDGRRISCHLMTSSRAIS